MMRKEKAGTGNAEQGGERGRAEEVLLEGSYDSARLKDNLIQISPKRSRLRERTRRRFCKHMEQKSEYEKSTELPPRKTDAVQSQIIRYENAIGSLTRVFPGFGNPGRTGGRNLVIKGFVTAAGAKSSGNSRAMRAAKATLMRERRLL